MRLRPGTAFLVSLLLCAAAAVFWLQADRSAARKPTQRPTHTLPPPDLSLKSAAALSRSRSARAAPTSNALPSDAPPGQPIAAAQQAEALARRLYPHRLS